MKDDIERAIKVLAGKAEQEADAGDAMKFAQGCVNLTHALATMENVWIARREAQAKFGEPRLQG